MSQNPADAHTPGQCRLAEIVQFNCNPQEDTAEWHCLPIIRIFRICQNRPAVELTRFVEMDVETGAVHVPPRSRASCGGMLFDTSKTLQTYLSLQAFRALARTHAWIVPE
ncbi:hypothetical protein C8Q73DRAFT_437670 [Cubamyces lactineus]|nr:hypothetical protein C8Q73DRAFT_437670 [Cubamyces lactineus]